MSKSVRFAVDRLRSLASRSTSREDRDWLVPRLLTGMVPGPLINWDSDNYGVRDSSPLYVGHCTASRRIAAPRPSLRTMYPGCRARVSPHERANLSGCGSLGFDFLLVAFGFLFGVFIPGGIRLRRWIGCPFPPHPSPTHLPLAPDLIYKPP